MNKTETLPGASASKLGLIAAVIAALRLESRGMVDSQTSDLFIQLVKSIQRCASHSGERAAG